MICLLLVDCEKCVFLFTKAATFPSHGVDLSTKKSY